MRIRALNAASRALLAATAGMALACFAAGCTPQAHGEQDGALASLRAQLDEARAQSAIRDLMHAYGRLIDARDFDGFAKLWTDDAVYVGGPGSERLVGGPAIAGFLRNIITSNPSGVGEPNFHIFFNEEISVAGEQARGTSMSAFVAPGATGAPAMVMLARYEDEFVRQDGTWKFRRRVVSGLLPAPRATSN
ncbi:MAG: nuclear transport factor 2 family protein [Steroidobacteraceae bacterium]|nr:nuclear transport factor 2 family protein [Steroidobacteraceae bacterium]